MFQMLLRHKDSFYGTEAKKGYVSYQFFRFVLIYHLSVIWNVPSSKPKINVNDVLLFLNAPNACERHVDDRSHLIENSSRHSVFLQLRQWLIVHLNKSIR